jgi:SAM-dependent methyltransferase
VSTYKNEFFSERHARTVYAAREILGITLDIVPSLKSAVDVGCGVGTWLEVLQERGVDDVFGIDGDWVNDELLRIPGDRFEAKDLTQPIDVGRRFDLAISLEVAEHLPESAAEIFVTSLTGLSDRVLFSAAIPYQGGTHHVNERWVEYWVERFEACGFVGFDPVRPRIWHDDKIRLCYRQNVVLFAARDAVEGLRLGEETGTGRPRSMVHPDMYLKRISKRRSLRRSVKRWRESLGGTKAERD